MRIKDDAQELARLKYIQRAQEISSHHYKKIKQHEQNMPASELNLMRNQMVMEQKRKAADSRPDSSNQVNIYGHNLGPIQQGGKNNTQTVNINAQFNAKIQELLNLIEVARELSPVQKLKASTDIKYVQELSKLEPSAEVQEEAKSRLDGVTSVISLSAEVQEEAKSRLDRPERHIPFSGCDGYVTPLADGVETEGLVWPW